MVKINWVKIPAGEYPTKLSQEQLDALMQKARDEAGYANWSSTEQQQFEDYFTKKNQRWRLLKLGEKVESPFPLPKEIVALEKKYAGMDNLITVANRLAMYTVTTVRVKMKSFYISRFPITINQCEEFFNKFKNNELQKQRTGILISGESDNKPETVGWHIADLFCQWIGARLPTSVEWECAARGFEGFLYPWGDEWDTERLNLSRVSTPVDAHPTGVSPFGVWDMIGNRAEWTMDLSTHYEGGMTAIYQGPIVKELEKPYWLEYIATFGGTRPIDAPPYYIGFRPMLDSWRKRSWTGFNVA